MTRSQSRALTFFLGIYSFVLIPFYLQYRLSQSKTCDLMLGWSLVKWQYIWNNRRNSKLFFFFQFKNEKRIARISDGERKLLGLMVIDAHWNFVANEQCDRAKDTSAAHGAELQCGHLFNQIRVSIINTVVQVHSQWYRACERTERTKRCGRLQ